MIVTETDQDRSSPERADRTRDRGETTTRARVLVVDDDENTLRALESLLRAEGFTTSTAPDGAAALAEAMRALPDIVLTDLHMPRMDGLELCMRLHELDDDLPVIIMTAQADMQSAIESLRERAEDFLTKPVEFGAVLWRIERAMERRTAMLERDEARRTLNARLVEHAEAEAQHRAQLNALLANLSEGVVIASPSGRVVMINDTARVILGFERKDPTVDALNSLEARDLEDGCLGSEQRPLVRALGGESFSDYEVVHVTPSGDRRRVMSTGTNVRGRDGNVALVIVVFRDVTEQRHVEQQRAEYLALVSHDLRNPLNVVLASLSFLKNPPMDGNAGPSSRAFLVHAAERAERNARRMTVMLDEIGESTSLESETVALRCMECELRTVVANVLDSVNEGHSGRVTVETDDAPPYVVQADAPRLERVVANFVTNALKYSAEGTPVTVRLAHEGKDAVLEVTDRGIGIPPESVNRLFERYYRSPGGMAHAGGLGLGLYIAHMIVEAHGGRIDVSSEVGKGSTFRLSLPSFAPARASDAESSGMSVTDGDSRAPRRPSVTP